MTWLIGASLFGVDHFGPWHRIVDAEVSVPEATAGENTAVGRIRPGLPGCAALKTLTLTTGVEP